MYTIAYNEGVSGLYKGYVSSCSIYNLLFSEILRAEVLGGFRLTASLLREATYSTLRIGLYDVFKDTLKAHDPRKID
jgi:hypothetical protein